MYNTNLKKKYNTKGTLYNTNEKQYNTNDFYDAKRKRLDITKFDISKYLGIIHYQHHIYVLLQIKGMSTFKTKYTKICR